MNNLGSSDAINTDKPIISTIKGLEFINLGSIENINLNSMGIDDDLILLFSPGILPAIKVLNLADNNITRINNITNLSTLEYLDLSFKKPLSIFSIETDYYKIIELYTLLTASI